MSRILKPNPGECVDRQTILQLKMKYGAGKSDSKVTTETTEMASSTEHMRLSRTKMEDPSPINIQPFADEHEMIQEYLEKNYFPDIAAFPDKQKNFDVYLDQLLEINESLWKLEDQARILREAPDKDSMAVKERKAEVLDLITESNDRRALMVKQINSLWNIYSREKLHK